MISRDNFRLLRWTADALYRAKRKTKPAHPRVVDKLQNQLYYLCQEWKKDLVAARILTQEGDLIK